MIARSREHGLTDQLAWATSIRGRAITEQGRHEQGIVLTQEGLAASRATGAGLLRPYFLCLLAEAWMERGRFDEGLSALTEGLADADEHENRIYVTEKYRLKGNLFLKHGDSHALEAQNCFGRAIEIAREQHAKSWELRATMSLARLLDRQGKRAEARAILADIYNWFTEGFDTSDLKDAGKLLDELGA
jgi:predicted ATPase